MGCTAPLGLLCVQLRCRRCSQGGAPAWLHQLPQGGETADLSTLNTAGLHDAAACRCTCRGGFGAVCTLKGLQRRCKQSKAFTFTFSYIA